MYKHIICEEIGSLGRLTLNSEKTLNSLSVPMIAEAQEVLSAWKYDDNIACVFLEGAGQKAFCAGGDVRRLYDGIIQQNETAPGIVPQVCLDFFVQEYRLDYEIHRYPKPIVVWADGIVMGGGIGLAAGASHRVVTEKSKFAMPEITIGLYPDVGGTWFLNRMPDGFGLYLGMTGTRLNANDCLYLGLADHFVRSDLKEEVLNKLINASWQQSNQSNSQLVTQLLTGLGEGLNSIPSLARDHSNLISRFASVSSVDEFRQILSSIPNTDDWFAGGIKSFQTGSPSSAHIIFEQLRRGKGMALEDVFRSELNLSAQCTLHPDFPEGVRALLVDKDQSPKWQPSSHAEITKPWIDSYFMPLWTEDQHPLKDLGNSALCQK